MVVRLQICSDAARAAAVVLLAAALVAPGVGRAQAAQVVTVCGTDDAAGGLNLADALSQGGDITIQCPTGQTDIKLGQTRNLPNATSITSSDDLTLSGPPSGPMFTVARELILSNLRVVGPGTIATGDTATVSLQSVVVDHSSAAFLVRTFRADGSHFTNNGDITAPATGSAVIGAETVELTNSEFVGNGDHPVAGGTWASPSHVPLSRRVTIDNTTFSKNPSGLLFIDAQVTIRQSRFLDNGRPYETAFDTWGCCGGAMTLIRSEVSIFGSDFSNNSSSGFGGAIQAIGSRLTIDQSTFSKNHARAGGAIMSWGRPPLVNIWSSDDWTDLPRLAVSRSTFTDNGAEYLGGAVVFAGSATADGSVFTGNASVGQGGAIAVWNAAPLVQRYSGVLDALVSNTAPKPADTLTLARSIFTDNSATDNGGALALGDASVALGNIIVARNRAPAGSAIWGTQLRLINVVVADNAGTGVETTAGGALTVGNSAIVRNAVNCSLATAPVIVGPNMQYPGSDCGPTLQESDPGFDGRYAPDVFSSARGAGDLGLCISEPTVAGIDLFGSTRVNAEGVCAIGAIERDLLDAAGSGLTFGHQAHWGWYLFWALLLLFLLIVLFVLFLRRKKASSP